MASDHCQFCSKQGSPLFRLARDLIESEYDVGEFASEQTLYRQFVARAKMAMSEFQDLRDVERNEKR